MEITESARRHEIADVDIHHAWRNAMKIGVIEYDGEERIFVIGPSRSGELLELIAVPVSEPVRIIHADRLRPKFYDAL